MYSIKNLVISITLFMSAYDCLIWTHFFSVSPGTSSNRSIFSSRTEYVFFPNESQMRSALLSPTPLRRHKNSITLALFVLRSVSYEETSKFKPYFSLSRKVPYRVYVAFFSFGRLYPTQVKRPFSFVLYKKMQYPVSLFSKIGVTYSP